MSYYAHCASMDIIGRVKNSLLNGGYTIRPGDGRLVAAQRPAWNVPWHYVEYSYDVDCHLWNDLIFKEVFQQRFVPSKCQNCYKVVVRPRTLSELFKLLAIQKDMEWPAKCGCELREDVPHLYGGYFYNCGIDEGRECYRLVRAAVDEHISKDVPVILKRACTEYERACGPSDEWVVTEEQAALEKMVDRYVVKDSQLHKQPEHVIAHVHKKWIEYAYKNGDETYKEFTGGEPLFAPYVTYHEGDNQRGGVEQK